MGFIAAKAMESEAIFLWIGLLTIIIIVNKVIFVKFSKQPIYSVYSTPSTYPH